MAQDSNNDSRYWRDKYLDLVNEHDGLKLKSSKQHDLLRRALVVTSLLGTGQSSRIDKGLTDLRQAVKTQNPNLIHSLTDLEKAVDGFEAQKTNQVSMLLGLIGEISTKLDRCPLPAPLLKRVKQVRQEAVQALESQQGYGEQLQHWLQILGELATLDGYDEPTSKWWKRWFKSQKEQSEAVAETLSHSAQTALAGVQNTTDTSESDEPGFSVIAAEVAQTLQDLLTQLVIPERLDYQLQSLKQRLNTQMQWFELVPMLEDTTQFLLQCLESSQVKIEQFLQSLDQRLQAIRTLVSEAMIGGEERARARESLDQMVREQLSDIRSLITGKSDLEDLGLSVREHLVLIIDAMEKYKVGEEEREKRLSEQLAQLQARVDEMEKEVEDKRQAFEEQKRKAAQDVLTGLPNRQGYQDRLADELARHHRYGSPLALVVCDIDHFKRINDTYGHLAGDKVLQLIARMLRKNIRDVDFVARYGGEEFVILMPETTAVDAHKAAEKLRIVIEQSPFNFRKERVSITMSFGISEFLNKDSPEQVFERADKALYQSKHAGRNHCTLA
ncbi:MAG: hypothetical protein RL217_1699 [Pseudomonadota bacterium]|jgi:diguanylate cyclase